VRDGLCKNLVLKEKRPSVRLAFKGGVIRLSVVSRRHSFFIQQAKDFGRPETFCRQTNLFELLQSGREIICHHLESIFDFRADIPQIAVYCVNELSCFVG